MNYTWFLNMWLCSKSLAGFLFRTWMQFTCDVKPNLNHGLLQFFTAEQILTPLMHSHQWLVGECGMCLFVMGVGALDLIFPLNQQYFCNSRTFSTIWGPYRRRSLMLSHYVRVQIIPDTVFFTFFWAPRNAQLLLVLRCYGSLALLLCLGTQRGPTGDGDGGRFGRARDPPQVRHWKNRNPKSESHNGIIQKQMKSYEIIHNFRHKQEFKGWFWMIYCGSPCFLKAHYSWGSFAEETGS